MEITFEVTLDYGDDELGDQVTPEADDIGRAVRKGLDLLGFLPVDVTAARL